MDWCDDFKERVLTMLVLSRQEDESIVIGDDIQITVVQIRGDKVRLGFEAPREVPVHRLEVFKAIRRSEAQAASSATEAATEVRQDDGDEPDLVPA